MRQQAQQDEVRILRIAAPQALVCAALEGDSGTKRSRGEAQAQGRCADQLHGLKAMVRV